MIMKPIKLPNTNLYLMGKDRDINGNTILRLRPLGNTGFSIQMTGSLPKTCSILTWLSNKDIAKLSNENLTIITQEVTDYITNYGTPSQKKKLQLT